MPGPLTALLARGRAIPWAALYGAAKWIYERWKRIPERDRREIGELVRKSKGRRGNLSDREYERLKALVKKAVTERG